jgi:hypothetical protein
MKIGLNDRPYQVVQGSNYPYSSNPMSCMTYTFGQVHYFNENTQKTSFFGVNCGARKNQDMLLHFRGKL